MKIKRTVEIFIETRRRMVICQTDETMSPTSCAECGATMLSVGQAAAFLAIDGETISRLIERGAAVHCAATAAGATLVCPASVAAILDGKDINRLLR